MAASALKDWIEAKAAEIATRAERELEALVAVSSPSGDAAGAEEAVAVATALVPPDAGVQRPACSSPDHAPDLLARMPGEGEGRLLLLGHLDTVIAHGEHRPLRREGGWLVGPGAVDMKGGVVLALGVMRALAERRQSFREVALLLVNDEEWRTHEFVHATGLGAWDSCLCFEAGEAAEGGGAGVVVRRKAAATLRVRASGRSSHSGTAPDEGQNALLALTAAAEAIAACHAPHGADRLTAVPTVIRSGEAFNVVPAAGELHCDLRADRLTAFEQVVASVPGDRRGATLSAELVRRWPGMDTRAATAPTLQRASRLAGREILGLERGGASDASHFAAFVPITIDGLGPIGAGAHSPTEHVITASLGERARIALAIAVVSLALD